MLPKVALSIYLEIHSTSFPNARCWFRGFVRQKAGKPTLWKGAFASPLSLTAKTRFLLDLRVCAPVRAHRWEVLANAIGQLAHVCRCHSSDSKRTVWPCPVGSLVRRIECPSAHPQERRSAELTRWVLQARKPGSLHRSHYAGKGNKTQVGLTLPP